MHGRKTIIWPYFFWKTSRTPPCVEYGFPGLSQFSILYSGYLKKDFGFWIPSCGERKKDSYHLEEVILIVTLITLEIAIISECLLHIYMSDFRLVLIYGASGFPWWLGGKEFACNAGDLSLIPGLGRSPGEANGNTLHYSCLGHPTDRGAWQATVHRVTELNLVTNQLLYNIRIIIPFYYYFSPPYYYFFISQMKKNGA